MLFIFVIANIITTSHAQRPTRCFLNHLHSLYLCTYSSILGAYKSRIHQIRVKKYNKNSYIRTLIVSSEKKGRERVAVICFDYILFELCLCFLLFAKYGVRPMRKFLHRMPVIFWVISFQMEENINGLAIGVQYTETTR